MAGEGGAGGLLPLPPGLLTARLRQVTVEATGSESTEYSVAVKAGLEHAYAVIGVKARLQVTVEANGVAEFLLLLLLLLVCR